MKNSSVNFNVKTTISNQVGSKHVVKSPPFYSATVNPFVEFIDRIVNDLDFKNETKIEVKIKP